ncbi:MAG: protein kinase [Gloeotrichia echinulata IR180]
MLGQMLYGRYEITQELARGGFGATFLAIDHGRPGKPQCVVKQLKPLATDPKTLAEAKRLFIQEAEILEQLGEHNQIPRLLAYREEDIAENQEFYLVQEYIAGHDLGAELPPNKQLSENEVIQLLVEILEVLAFVHQENVIHRDIKPANIRRRQSDGKIVLIDFGAVKQVKGLEVNQQGQTKTVPIGTPGYMPSEQAQGNPKFSSDIYAVGIIGLQAITGLSAQKLEKDFHTEEIIWRDKASIPVSSKFAEILDKMVRYYFNLRYETASAALADLQQLLQPISPTIPVIPPNKPPKPNRTPLLIGLGILAVSTIIVFTNVIIPKQENFLPYENSQSGIKLKYPEGWERQDINNIITGEIVIFLSPKKSSNDPFPEKVTISVEKFDGTLEQSSKVFRQEISKNLPDAKIIDESSITLANKPGSKLIFTGKIGQDNLKTLQVWTLKNEQAYTITYTANIGDYDEFIQTAETMIKSFGIN